MKEQRFSRKTVLRVAGVVAFFAVGLGGGAFLSKHVFAKKESAAVPKLSEVAATPEQMAELDLSSLPPIGLSPVPLEAPQLPSSVEPAKAEKPLEIHAHNERRGRPSDGDVSSPKKSFKIPWANPYPARPFSLTDQDGNQVSLKDFSGKVVVVNFIYTHCKTICPLLIQELMKLHENLGSLMNSEVLFLSITIDPKRDTPETLRRYGDKFGINFRNWRFLTGSEEKVREVLDAYRVHVEVEEEPEVDKGRHELGHSAPIYLIDQWGRVRKRTAPTMMVRIVRPAIEWLVKEGASH